MSTLRPVSSTHVLALAAIVALTTACTVNDQKTPDLSGPSELGLSIMVTASPQVLPRDGGSTATISVRAFNSTGQPQKRQRLLMLASVGTLNLTDVTTDDNGNAPAVTYLAPGINEPVSQATVWVTPVENGDLHNADARNVNSRTVVIELRGPEVPVPAFTFQPANPAVQDIVTFDASATKFGASACSTACSYTWDFGDGSNNIGATTNGMVIQHSYSTSGVFLVTLNVTGPAGTSSSLTKTLVVTPPALPVAEFDVSPASPSAGVAVLLDASRSSVGLGATIVQYVWTFGDGSPALTTPDPAAPPVIYVTAGDYNVTLYVVDSLGRRSTTKVQKITVK